MTAAPPEDEDAVNNGSRLSSEPEALSQLLNSQLEPILATRLQPATTMMDVMWAVVEALQLMDDAQQDFLHILKFGVNKYVSRSSNRKNIECTFAVAE